MEELRGIVRVENGKAGHMFAPAASTSGASGRSAVATLNDEADPPGNRADDPSSWRGGGLASYDVFISFRGGDRQIAQRLRGLLARFGVRAFVDETGIVPGTDWASSLRECLAASRAVIALVGPAWALLERPHEDWVLRELTRALAGGTPILPVCAGRSEDTKSKLAVLPDAFRIQAVEIPLEPTSADARRIVVALGHVNVLVNTPTNRAIASRLRTKKVVMSVAPRLACGRNVAITASRGSGRSRLLVDIAAWAAAGVIRVMRSRVWSCAAGCIGRRSQARALRRSPTGSRILLTSSDPDRRGGGVLPATGWPRSFSDTAPTF